MRTRRHALLIIGSLKEEYSTSEFIGAYLLDLLTKRGFKTEKVYVNNILKSKIENDRFFSILDDSEIVVFSSPLYIDCQPYLMARLMEKIAKHRKEKKDVGKSKFLIISNGGYPETCHNETAVSIYKCFAAEVGFEWLGGLAMGMGAALSVPIIRKIGGFTDSIKKSLSMTAEAIADHKPVPVEAINIMAEPLVPIWFYSFMARSIARFFSITNMAWNIYAKPIQQDLQ